MRALMAALALTVGLAVSGSPSASVSNYQSLWWNPQESGWGINLAHQGNTIFAFTRN